MTQIVKESNRPSESPVLRTIKIVFVRGGILPWFLLGAIIIFTGYSDSFLTTYNVMLIGRQATYLVLVAMGQMVALLTAGLDLSVGSIFAITSVVRPWSWLNTWRSIPKPSG